MVKFDLDKQQEITIQNDFIALDKDGNEVKTYHKEIFTLRQLYQTRDNLNSTLASVQIGIDIIEKAQTAAAQEEVPDA